MKQFKIVHAKSYQNLEDLVNKYITEGWVPHGEMVPVRCSTSISFNGGSHDHYEYTQSMVLQDGAGSDYLKLKDACDRLIKHIDNKACTPQQEVIKTIQAGRTNKGAKRCPAMDIYCTYYSYQLDSNGEVAICYCGHPENRDDTEGNCTFELCPRSGDLL